MKKAIKKLWLKALRGNKYKQARGALNKNGGFCCLGVLCDIYAKETGKGKWYRQNRKTRQKGFVCNYPEDQVVEFFTELPGAVVEWAGLNDRNPKVVDGALSFHNDGPRDPGTDKLLGKGKTFRQIANLIDKYL